MAIESDYLTLPLEADTQAAQREQDRQKAASVLQELEAERARDRQAAADVLAEFELERRAQHEDQKLGEFLDRTVGNQSLPVASVVERDNMSVVEPDPERLRAAQDLAARLGTDEVAELFHAFPLVQEAWLASGRDINRFKKDFPEFYERISQNQSFAETIAEEEARLQREKEIEKKRYEYQLLFPAEKLTGQERKAAVIRAAQATGADPQLLDDNFEEVQKALAAVEYDPVRFENEHADVAQLLRDNPDLSGVGLFDKTLKFLGRRIRFNVDAGLTFVGTGLSVLGSAARSLRLLEQNLGGPQFTQDALEFLEKGWTEGGQELLDRRSAATIVRQQRAQFSGTFDPRTWDFGDRNIEGLITQLVSVYGSFTPFVLATVAGGLPAATILGTLSETGGAAQDAEEIIDQLAAQGQLYDESEVYRYYIDNDVPHEQALAQTKQAAATAAADATVLLAALGSAASAGFLAPMRRILSKSFFRQGLGRVAASAGEEVVQETGVGILGRWGLNVGAGTSVPVVDESVFPSMFWGAVGGGSLALGGVYRGFKLDTALREIQQSVEDIARSTAGDGVVEAVLEASRASETAKARPAAVAKLIEDAAAEAGLEVGTLYLDPEVAAEVFGQSAESAVEALTGDEGALAEALETGSRLSIPLDRLMEFLQKEGEFDKALAEHLTVDGGLSLAERRRLDAEVERLADQIEEQMAAEEAAQEAQERAFEQSTEDVAPTLEISDAERVYATRAEEQLTQLGVLDKRSAKRAVALNRALIRTLAARQGRDVAEVFGAYAARIEATEAQVQSPVPEGTPEASAFLSERWGRLTAEERQAEFFTDTNTGVLNERGFSLLPDDPSRPLLIVISPRALKGVNDTLGHDVANAMFRRMAEVLRRHDPTVAKVGPDFVLRAAHPSTLRQILAEFEAMPEFAGLTPTGAVHQASEGLDFLRGLHDQIRDEMRASGALPPRGTLPPIDRRAFTEAMRQVPEAQPATIPDALREHFESLSAQEQFETTYIDQDTGLLSAAGYYRLPPKKFRAVVDLNGLRIANDFASKAFGNEILQTFGDLVRKEGAAEFDMAHVSGDEYALHSDDSAALKEFLQRVKEVARTAEIYFEDEATGETITFTGITFEQGIGRTDAEAEANLKKAKRKSEGRGLRGTVESILRRISFDIDLGADGEAQAPVRRVQDGRQGADGRRQRFVPEAARRRVAETSARKAVAAALDIHTSPEEFFRESGRVFFHLANEAQNQVPETPEQQAALSALRKDLQALAEFVGAKDFSSITTEQLDRLATGLLAWLAEGKAPSAGLTQAFEWYKLTLQDLYKRAEDVEAVNPDAELNDEVRDIFSRLVATDEEILKLRTAMGNRVLYPSIVAMSRALGRDVTAEEWMQHVRDHAAANSRAAQKIYQRVLRERAEEKEAWYKQKLADYRRQFEEEFETLPARILYLALRGEMYVDGKIEKVGPASQLIYEDLVDVVGPLGARRFNTVRRSRLGKKHKLTPTPIGDLDPDLLRHASVLPNTAAKWAKYQAEEKMRAEHPGILQDVAELRKLIKEEHDRQHDPTKLLDQLTAIGDQGAKIEVEARKRVAQRIVARKTLGQINEAALNKIMREERVMGDRARRAILKGQNQLAANLVLQQMVLRYQWSAMRAALKKKQQVHRTLQKYRRKKHFVALAKADPKLRDGLLSILEGLGLREPPPDRDTQPPSMEDVANTIRRLTATSQASDPFDVGVMGRILAQGKEWNDLTVTELRKVEEAVRAIVRASRVPRRVLDGFSGERVEIGDAAEKIVAELSAELPKREAAGDVPTKLEQLRRAVSIVHAYAASPETLLAAAVGYDPESAIYRHIILPLMNGKYVESQLGTKVRERVLSKLREVPRETLEKWQQPVDPDLFPDHTEAAKKPRTVKEIVMLAFYIGAEQNIEALELGRGITYEQALEAIERYLDKETMDWVQEVFDTLEELWPMAREVHERTTGQTAQALTPREIVTPWGTYRGGYMMAVYDWDVAGNVSKTDPSSSGDFIDPGFVPPGTPIGQLKSRVPGFKGVLKLDLGTIPRALDQHIHHIAMYEPVVSAARILLNPKVDAAMKTHLGPDALRQLKQWVRDVGYSPTSAGTIHAAAFSGVMRHLRRAPVASILGYKPTTALADILNPFQAAVALNVPLPTVLNHLRRTATSPRQSLAHAVEKSDEVKLVLQQFDNKLRRELDAIMKDWGPIRRGYETYLSNAFFFIDQMQKVVVPTIWNSAYDHFLRQELEAGNPDAEKVAVLKADSVLRNSIPTFNLVDQSAALRDRSGIGTLLMFHSFLSVTYQQRARILDPYFKAQGFKNSAVALAKLSPKLLAHSAIFNLVGEWVLGRGPKLGGAYDDEEKALRAGMWALMKMLESAAVPMPFGSDISHLMGEFTYSEAKGIHYDGGPPGGVRTGPIAIFIDALARTFQQAARGDLAAEGRLFKLARTAAPLFGTPIYPIQATESLMEIIDDPGEFEDMAEVVNKLFGYRDEFSTVFTPLNPRGR